MISPLAFQRPDELSDQEALHETEAGGNALALTAVGTEQGQQLAAMLLGLGIPHSEVVSHWGALDSNERVVSRCAVMAEEKLVGYLACPQPIEETTIVGRLAIDETSPNPRATARLLLNKLLLRAREVAPSMVRLELAPPERALARGTEWTRAAWVRRPHRRQPRHAGRLPPRGSRQGH